MRIGKHHINVEKLPLKISLFSWSFYEWNCFNLILWHKLSFVVDKPEIVQRFHIFSIGCSLKVFQTFFFVLVLVVTIIEGTQVVQSSRKIVFGSFAIITQSFLWIWCNYLIPCFLIVKSVLIQESQVSHCSFMSHSSCLLPHFQILIGFSILIRFIQEPQSINCLGIVLLSCYLVVLNSFIHVFIQNFAFFVQNSSNPLCVWELLKQFFDFVTVRN